MKIKPEYIKRAEKLVGCGVISIAEALQSTADEATERAARIADNHIGCTCDIYDSHTCCSMEIAKAIRSLKSKEA